MGRATQVRDTVRNSFRRATKEPLLVYLDRRRVEGNEPWSTDVRRHSLLGPSLCRGVERSDRTPDHQSGPVLVRRTLCLRTSPIRRVVMALERFETGREQTSV